MSISILRFLGWLILTVAISWYNANAVGRWWTESSDASKPIRFLLWMGAIMAWCGWFCVFIIPITLGMYYLHIFEAVAGLFQITLEPTQLEELIQTVFDLAYLLIIFPVLGSGIAIWAHSMLVAWERRDASSIGVAVWNSFAQTRNTVRAIGYVPKTASRVRIRTSKNSKGIAGLVYLLLLLLPIVISAGLATWVTVAIAKAADEQFTDEMLRG